MLFDALDLNTNRIHANTTKPVRKPHTHAVALAAAVFHAVRSSQRVSAASVPVSVGILLSALFLGKKKVAAVELAVRREVYCAKGRRDEPRALATEEARRTVAPRTFTKTNNATFFRRVMRTVGDGRAFALVGYVDGLHDEYVVEAKNRML